MKDYLRSLLSDTSDPNRQRNVLREYLQARILGSLQRCGAMIPLAFHGGTALRFLFDLPRSSEDLDFALEGAQAEYDLPAYLRAILKDLSAENYDVKIKVNDRKIVHSAMVGFPGLLFEMGLSPNRNQVFSIKLEIDTRPPSGAALTVSIVRRYEILRLQHHDRASLLAGKLHAVLQRPYPKGRDLYDLIWYLSDRNWPAPNLTLLNNALKQTNWEGGFLNVANWKDTLRARILRLDWSHIQADVRPFLERPDDAKWVTLDNLMRLLGSEGMEAQN